MGLFFNVSQKKLLQLRNDIFISIGIPALRNNGFDKAPFPESLFGKNNVGGDSYELCRVSKESQLEMITTHISKGDRWIKIFLNIFRLRPELRSLGQLKNIDGMQFRLPPNSRSQMRLDIDGFKGMPLFRTEEFKIKSFFTESGFQKRIEELGRLIERDLNNIDPFIQRWHELHQVMITSWDGKRIET